MGHDDDDVVDENGGGGGGSSSSSSGEYLFSEPHAIFEVFSHGDTTVRKPREERCCHEGDWETQKAVRQGNTESHVAIALMGVSPGHGITSRNRTGKTHTGSEKKKENSVSDRERERERENREREREREIEKKKTKYPHTLCTVTNPFPVPPSSSSSSRQPSSILKPNPNSYPALHILFTTIKTLSHPT